MSSDMTEYMTESNADKSKPDSKPFTDKKSTGSHPKYVTRRQRQAAKNEANLLQGTSDDFMANFNPETSVREKRKLDRRINQFGIFDRPLGALFNETGVHIATHTDLCDCLNKECEGCFFACPKCGSQKCGPECRVHRKYVVEEIEFHGYEYVTKNTIQKQ